MSTLKATERLAELIRAKRRVLEQLHQVGVRQGELVAAGDVGTLLKLLAAKQRLLDGLQSVERDLTPFRDDDPEKRVWARAECRAACAADAVACRTLLAEVVEMERRHEREMTDRRDRVASQLKRAHAAHGARDAYQTHQHPTAPVAAPPDGSVGADSIDLISGA